MRDESTRLTPFAPAPSARVTVAADDRTGALETAGAIAERIGQPVDVHSGPDGGTSLFNTPVTVHDLATRHLDPAAAASRVDLLPRSAVNAHKIDSTLRGNWATEIVSRYRRDGCRAIIVAALPSAGRICRDGVVYEHGVPVALGATANDARQRQRLRFSRPAELLTRSGATDVIELNDSDALDEWLSSGNTYFAVSDAASDSDLDAIGEAWASHTNVLLAGTSAAIAAGVTALARRTGNVAAVAPTHAPGDPLPSPVLVVCGSLNEHARDELATLVDRGITLGIAGDDLAALTNAMERNHHAILTTDAPIHRPVSFEDAQQAVQALARATQELSSLALTIVIVGGDTAAAVLGNGVQTVGGLVAYGTPWCVPHDNGPLIVTRSGGFGAAITLEQLLFGKLGL